MAQVDAAMAGAEAQSMNCVRDAANLESEDTFFKMAYFQIGLNHCFSLSNCDGFASLMVNQE